MENMTIEKEKKRIYSILEKANVSQVKREALESIVAEIAFMRLKLDEAKADMIESDIAIPYDNGGGQSGIRENPIFKAYESLLKSYMSGMEKVLAILPKDAQEELVENTEKGENILELVKSMHKRSV